MITLIYDADVHPDAGGTYFPSVVCDVCGKRIVRDGNAYWLIRLADGEVHPQVWHTHKHPC